MGNLNLFEQIQRRAVKWILKEPFVSYSDREFLDKQFDIDLLPIKFKFLHTDLILFHNVVYDTVKITMPHYIVKLGPGDFPKVTRQNRMIAERKDNLMYKCTTKSNVKCFKNSYFVRTCMEWNKLPLSMREISDNEKFRQILKQHLWNLLGLKPD